MDVLKGEEAKRVASGRGPLQRRAPSCGIAAPLSELGEIAERRRLADESVSDRKKKTHEGKRRPRGCHSVFQKKSTLLVFTRV